MFFLFQFYSNVFYFNFIWMFFISFLFGGVLKKIGKRVSSLDILESQRKGDDESQKERNKVSKKV